MGGRKQRKYRNQKVSVWELKFCEFCGLVGHWIGNIICKILK